MTPFGIAENWKQPRVRQPHSHTMGFCAAKSKRTVTHPQQPRESHKLKGGWKKADAEARPRHHPAYVKDLYGCKWSLPGFSRSAGGAG